MTSGEEQVSRARHGSHEAGGHEVGDVRAAQEPPADDDEVLDLSGEYLDPRLHPQPKPGPPKERPRDL
jgi:hypothetical protein